MLTGRRTERGFTLMELIVGMLLLVVVMSLMVASMVKLGESNSDATANRSAQRQALDALESMRRDLRVARSPAKDEWDGRRETLRQLVYFERDDGPANSDDRSRQVCAGMSYVDCMRDVVVANPTNLWFRADVRGGTGWEGAECVGYVFGSTGLTRYVSSQWRTCGPGAAAGAVADRLIRGTVTGSPFQYTVRAHPSIPPTGIARPEDCATTQVANAPGRTRNFITSVDVDLRSVFSERRQSATNGVDTSLVITGRTSGDHAYAVGCSH